jgi:L-ascorbate metabolism protein UlaG (beta-lactamase superfamily)
MERLENIDVALLPIGGKNFTMGISEAVKAAQKINPRVVAPMHRFESRAEEYKELLETGTSIKVVLLDIGEVLKL